MHICMCINLILFHKIILTYIVYNDIKHDLINFIKVNIKYDFNDTVKQYF